MQLLTSAIIVGVTITLTQLLIVSYYYLNSIFSSEASDRFQFATSELTIGDKLSYINANLSHPERILPPKGELLEPFLRVRVSGTEANREVRDFVIEKFRELTWFIETDSFVDTTPDGEKNFTNIIVTHNPNAKRKLVLAAHYDSKYFPEDGPKFIGATDSALPCALLVDIAVSLNVLLNENLSQQEHHDITLQLIFFDGEEAFVRWTDQDSIYGARHLAARWSEDGGEKLRAIDTLVLLDLLGSQNIAIPNMHFSTTKSYRLLSEIEQKLHQAAFYKTFTETNFIFDPEAPLTMASIGDDHVPFMEKGVPVLHVIPLDFPWFWHTFGDNADILDSESIVKLSIIFKAFVIEYLKLRW